MTPRLDQTTGARPFAIRLREALDGVVLAYRSERNLRWQAALGSLAVAAGFLLGLDRAEWLWLLTSVFLVLGAEITNSGVEAAVDLASPEIQPLARYAKHVAAGAVLMAVAQSLVVAGLVLWPRLLPSVPEWPARVQAHPLLSLCLGVLAVAAFGGALGLGGWSPPGRNGERGDTR